MFGIVAAVAVGFVVILVLSSAARMFAMRTVLGTFGAAPATDANGFTNVLLLGVGDTGHDAEDLTDTIILASIDPVSTRSVVLLSIPRDLHANPAVPSASGRVNTIYTLEKSRLQYREGMSESGASIAAMRYVADELGAKLGVEVHGVIKGDFSALSGIVDALDGIDVDVPKRLYDPFYPVAEGQIGVFHIEEGMQHMDGKTALQYARSRYTTSDFDRSARQQHILSAIADELRSRGRIQQLRLLPSLYSEVQSHVETTFSYGELLGLAQLATGVSPDRILRFHLNFFGGSDVSEAQAGGFVYSAPEEEFEGASILLPTPVPGEDPSWRQVATFVQILLEYRRIFLAPSPVSLAARSGQYTQAWRLRNELARYAFAIDELDSIDATHKSTESSISYGVSNAKDTAKVLGTLLSLPVRHVSGTGTVQILLGTDFRYHPFQTLSGTLLQ